MNKYSYYTPTDLAEEIIKIIPKKDYDSIIDICCGTWNLLTAAKRYYPNASISGIDIDENIRGKKVDDARFILADGRKFSDEEAAKGKTYDLILSNPPFGNMNADELYWKDKKGNEQFSHLLCKRYEAEMILANINLAHDNSVIVLILPITFVRGETYKKARFQIASAFAILDVIELSEDAFSGKMLKTAVVIMEKVNSSNMATKYSFAKKNYGKWMFELNKVVGRIDVQNGNWCGDKFVESNIKIERGKIHSGCLNGGDKMILHCSSDYNGREWKPSVRYSDITTSVYAETGDIVINRIGKGVGFWRINDIDRVGVSDCLFVIKGIDQTIIRRLKDNTVDGRLNISPRGVSTRYITQNDIYRIIESD